MGMWERERETWFLAGTVSLICSHLALLKRYCALACEMVDV